MNLVIVGCGAMGAIHAQMASNCGLTIAICADVVRKNASTLAKRHNAVAMTDAFEAIRRPKCDVVVITTPTPTHADYIVAAAEAGKDIFCEKPFCRTLPQCKRALAAVDRAGVKLFVGHVVRYFQEFDAIKTQIEAGKIGKVGFIRTYRGGMFPKGEAQWYRDYKQSGGVTLDCIIHDFDWLRYMFGPVERVYAQHLQRTKPVALDYALVTLRMKSGVMATVTGSWAHPSGFRVKVEVCGDGGMIQFDSAESPVTLQRRERAAGAASVIVPASPVSISPYQLEWQDFLCWRSGESRPRVTPEDAVEAVRIGLAALESAAKGKPVSL